MLERIINRTREVAPLVHNITNYVTANDCANITLACGASPIMAEDIHEAWEITSMADALVINTGILTESKLSAMLVAGRRANELKHPVILDPVGVGASKFRTDSIRQLLNEIRFQVIRGNSSEVIILRDLYCIRSELEQDDSKTCHTVGVDATERDRMTEDNLERFIIIAKELALAAGAVIVMTGGIDIVTDGLKCYLIRNGHPMLAKITGSGCMLSCIIGAYCGANPQECLSACITAVGAIGLCGEFASERMVQRQEGNVSYRNHLIDNMSQMDGNILRMGIRLEER